MNLLFLRYLFSDKKSFEKRFRECFGFYPSNPAYYIQALTHKSLAGNPQKNNERLEFLGDSVLGKIVSEWLYNHFPEGSEGFLSSLRAMIVNRNTLNEISIKMRIAEFIKTDRHVLLSFNPPSNIFGNALEALIGAIFLDKGEIFVKKYVRTEILSKHIDLNMIVSSESNYKGRLYEKAAKDGFSLKIESSDEIKNGTLVFRVSIWVDDVEIGNAEGPKKKHAEQIASRMALEKLESDF